MKEARSKKCTNVCFHLYKILKSAKEIILKTKQISSYPSMREEERGRKEGLQRVTRKLLVVNVHYLDCGNDVIKLYQIIHFKYTQFTICQGKTLVVA